MNGLYDILCLCLIFFFALIIFEYIKKSKLVEGLTKKMSKYANNNTAITNYSTEQNKDFRKNVKYWKKIKNSSKNYEFRNKENKKTYEKS